MNNNLIVGIGGAGGNIIKKYSKKKGNNVTLLIDTSICALKIDSEYVDEVIVAGFNTLKGLGTGRNAKIGEICYEESKSEFLKKIISFNNIFIVIGGTGGTSGILTSLLKDIEGICKVKILIAAPLTTEGKNYMSKYDELIIKLKDYDYETFEYTGNPSVYIMEKYKHIDNLIIARLQSLLVSVE